MEKYRIKIETLENETIWYTPQMSDLFNESHTIGWFGLAEDGSLIPYSHSVVSFDEIEKAEEIVEKRKNNILKHQQSIAVTIDYKYL